MSNKEIAVFSVIVAIIVGAVVSFLMWDYNADKEYFAEKCQQIAELSNAQDHLVDYGECYIIKNNKLVKVEL